MRRACAALLCGLLGGAALAQTAVPLPGVRDRLRAAEVGLVINASDAYSVEVGEHYARRRRLQPAQVLRVALPARDALTSEEFNRLRERIERHFGPHIQALALAWTRPFAVSCNSITGALALGVDEALCRNSCGPSRYSPYFNAATLRPLADVGFRLSMLLAAPSIEQGKALVDRGVAADGALARAGRAPARALLLTSGDAARNVRAALYPAPGRVAGVDIVVAPAPALRASGPAVLVQVGSLRVDLDPPLSWASGGIGDHLTSVGGNLGGGHDQTTVLDWIASGAVASHGTVSEPCNHLQKFPHPQVLLGHYLQGATAIEAYWRSVAWPQQSLFVGEPLAAPFAPLLTRR
jgi:uncharacterized protein (TIGR03790 family)